MLVHSGLVTKRRAKLATSSQHKIQLAAISTTLSRVSATCFNRLFLRGQFDMLHSRRDVEFDRTGPAKTGNIRRNRFEQSHRLLTAVYAPCFFLHRAPAVLTAQLSASLRSIGPVSPPFRLCPRFRPKQTAGNWDSLLLYINTTSFFLSEFPRGF